MRFIVSLAPFLAAIVGTASFAQDSSDAVKGHAFAREVCAECHAVEAEERMSPVRHAPSFFRIANTDGMTKTALLVVLSNPHREMPDLILDRRDLNAVAAYILSLKID